MRRLLAKHPDGIDGFKEDVAVEQQQSSGSGSLLSELEPRRLFRIYANFSLGLKPMFLSRPFNLSAWTLLKPMSQPRPLEVSA